MSDELDGPDQAEVKVRDVHCRCGEKLVDEVTVPGVVVEEEMIPFRRTTDYLVCPACGSMYRVTDVGSDYIVDGAIVAEEQADSSG